MTTSLRPLHLLHLATIALAACGGTADRDADGDGTSSSTDGTSATGLTPSGYCAKKCIAEDRDRCMEFAGQFSDAFLAALDVCGDSPACLEPKLDAAPRTERQVELATDYCTRCGDTSPTCVSTFFVHDQPGGSIAMMSDTRLDAVEETCFRDLPDGSGKPNAGPLACRASFAVCQIPLISELGAQLVCRQRR